MLIKNSNFELYKHLIYKLCHLLATNQKFVSQQFMPFIRAEDFDIGAHTLSTVCFYPKIELKKNNT